MGFVDKVKDALTGASDEEAGQAAAEQIEGLAGNEPASTDVSDDPRSGASAASAVQPAAAPETHP